MNPKKVIRKEFESRLRDAEKAFEICPSSAIGGIIQAYKNVLTFIDSMQTEHKLRLGDKVRNKTLGVEGVVFDIGKDGVINVDCGVYQDYNINIDDWELVEDVTDDINVSADKEIRKYMTEHFNLYADGVLQSKKNETPLKCYDVIKIVEYFLQWYKERMGKVFPKWKKVSDDTGQTVLYKDGEKAVLRRFGYEIDLKELDKLPKE